jgi:hypothetical protein
MEIVAFAFIVAELNCALTLVEDDTDYKLDCAASSQSTISDEDAMSFVDLKKEYNRRISAMGAVPKLREYFEIVKWFAEEQSRLLEKLNKCGM